MDEEKVIAKVAVALETYQKKSRRFSDTKKIKGDSLL